MPEPSGAGAFRAFAAERRYGSATIDRWLKLPPEDAAALFDLAQALRLGENQLRDLWDWADEIGERDSSSLARLLGSDWVAAALHRRDLGRNDKLKVVKGGLRRLRYPHLAATEDHLAKLVRELRLPRNVRVTFPEFLEGDALRVEIVAENANALRAAVDALQAAIQGSTCENIFKLLEEAP